MQFFDGGECNDSTSYSNFKMFSYTIHMPYFVISFLMVSSLLPSLISILVRAIIPFRTPLWKVQERSAFVEWGPLRIGEDEGIPKVFLFPDPQGSYKYLE